MLRSRWLSISAAVAIAVSVGIAITIVVTFRAVDHHIVLHYTTLFGIDWLGQWPLAFILPGAMLLFVLLNVVLVVALTEHRFTHHVVAATNVFLTGLFTFASVLLLTTNQTFV